MTVRDEDPRFTLAWSLQQDMPAGSLVEVVEHAADDTGVTDVLVADQIKLLSDNGSSQRFMLMTMSRSLPSPQFPCIGPETVCSRRSRLIAGSALGHEKAHPSRGGLQSTSWWKPFRLSSAGQKRLFHLIPNASGGQTSHVSKSPLQPIQN